MPSVGDWVFQNGIAGFAVFLALLFLALWLVERKECAECTTLLGTERTKRNDDGLAAARELYEQKGSTSDAKSLVALTEFKLSECTRQRDTCERRLEAQQGAAS